MADSLKHTVSETSDAEKAPGAARTFGHVSGGLTDVREVRNLGLGRVI